MQTITDGEIRRETWYFDFLENLDGVEAIRPKEGFDFYGATTGFSIPHSVARCESGASAVQARMPDAN